MSTVKPRNITPDNTEFVIICFEGPDLYSMAGGLGVRVDNLSQTLADTGFVTHLFFIGDPDLPGKEVRCDGRLILHRWCQWLSKYHPGGVYDGENDKVADFNKSIPLFVKDNVVKPALSAGKLVMILGEEWQTAETMCLLSDALYNDRIRDKVVMFWNANNTFSFDRINWGRLGYVTTVTTVSRYMKNIMWDMGLSPLVIPNGIPRSLLGKVDDRLCQQIRDALHSDLVLCKVARWDPDKRWEASLESIALLKESGIETVFLARGSGSESYGEEIMAHARARGLTVKEATTRENNFNAYLKALTDALPANVINIRFHLPMDFLRVLYRSADGVLANSGHEPFGIVGLETMAAGGIAFTGGTGEDYAIPFVNSFVLETANPYEIVGHVMYLQEYPVESARMRTAARITARYFTWDSVLRNLISRLENQARAQGILGGRPLPGMPMLRLGNTRSIALEAIRPDISTRN